MPHRSGGALLSQNGQKVLRWFGIESIDPRRQKCLRIQTPEPRLAPGTITLITGPSGGGKSTLLRQLHRRHREASWIDVSKTPLPDTLVVDCFDSDRLESVLAMLARVGLGEAWTYLRRPIQLSEGQRRRLRWAIALWRACLLQDATQCYKQAKRSALKPANRVILSADEFCAVLDTVTARILSHCLRKSIDANRSVAVVLATARSDLEPALHPEVTVHCDFGQYAVVS